MASFSVAGLAASAAIMLATAEHDRQSLEDQARALARSTAHAAEREIATTFARLEGLLGAPALRSGDFAAFREQLERTPSPTGGWFVVADDSGQIVNSLLPAGDPRLPGNAGTTAPGMMNTARVILEENRQYVGGAMWGPVARIYTVAIGIPTSLGPDGRRGALMASVPQQRILALLHEQPLPSGWRAILVDQFSQVVARIGPEVVLGGDTPPTAWRSDALGQDHDAPAVAKDPVGNAILLARTRSDTVGWTAVVEVPLSVLQEPVTRAVMRILVAAGILLVLGLVAAWWLRARIVGSVDALTLAADAASERQQESEARFRHFWDHTPESLFMVRVTPEGDFVFEGLNPAHEAATGLTQQDIANRRPEDCLPAGTAATVRGRYRRCLERGAPQRYLESLELPHGRRDWETSLAPMHDPRTGRITLLVGTSRDVTDRLRAEETVHLNEERLRLALRAAAAGTWEQDASGDATHWSPEMYDLLGLDPAELEGRSLQDALLSVIHPGDRRQVEEGLRATDNEQPVSIAFRLARERCDGGARWLVAQGRTLREGCATGGRSRFMGVMVDVTERRRAEAAARDSLALLQSTLDALSVRIVILDADGIIVAVNAAWRRAADHGEPAYGSGPGTDYLAACEDAREILPIAGRVARGIRAVARGATDGYRDEYLRPGKAEDEDRWFQIRITRFGAGETLRLVVAHEDITEVRRSAMGLKVLTGRMLTMQDEERRRIARDLHDATLQDLAAVKIALDTAGPGSDTVLDEARAMLEKAIRDVRTLSYVLHPPLLDECGLATALAVYAEGFARRSGLRCCLDLDEDSARLIPPGMGVALFRIAQEAFANTHRHSGARTMHLRLRAEDGTVELRIEDDGRGFDPETAGRGSVLSEFRMLGVGIPGMRARLAQLGGALRIESGSTGTVVIARLPLHEEPAEKLPEAFVARSHPVSQVEPVEC